jgi:Ca2+-transporting ATPase
LETPLTRKISAFSRLMLKVILVLAAVTFVIGRIRGEPAVDMFMAAVALAVGAIPEGLPATVTITLAVGVARLARRKTIVRRLPAVETLGSTTVICSDKTGTLTENQMTVREIFAGGRLFELSGCGYDPAGAVSFGDATVPYGSEPALEECLRAGLLCNDAGLRHDDDRWSIHGDPTEAALIVAAMKGGLDCPGIAVALPRLDALPFESIRQYMATLHHDGGAGRLIIYKKGAIEHLLSKCIDALDDRGLPAVLDRSVIMHAADRMAAKGLRVLAFARRMLPADHSQFSHEHVAGQLTFLGIQGMEDPPREDAIRAIARCKDAGIAVKMITGDHVLTARSIALRLGIGGDTPSALSGRQLEAIPDSELPAIAEATPVFARVSPEQKVRLVKALQARGHIVAMTGDGVNDAPALRQADIGVAMGITGTDVARGAADIILTDDNFTSIESAVEEGRGVFDNLVKCIVWEIPCNFGEALTLLAAIVLGVALPALPVQLLWVNMMTAVVLGFALIFEPKENDLMSRPPRNPAQPIMDLPLFMRTCLLSLVILGGSFGLFLWEQAVRGLSVAEARTVVVNVIVVVEIFYLLSCRSLMRSPWQVGIFSNPWVLPCISAMMGLQLAFTYLPVMNRLFSSAPLDAACWLHVFLIGLFAFAAVELEKWLRRRSARDWQNSVQSIAISQTRVS